MLRTILSYLVLILVPAVSLAIAVVPYVVLKKRVSLRGFAKQSPSPSQNNEIATPRSARLAMTERENVSPNGISWKQLWLAFFVGLVGNVAWWWLIEIINNDKISIYLKGLDQAGVLFAFILYCFFIVITPFVFSKLRNHHFTAGRIVYDILLSLITAGLVLGVWIVLAIIGYRQLFYQLN